MAEESAQAVLIFAHREKTMSDDAEKLRQIRTQTLALLEELTRQPKPTYQLEGPEIAWSEYLARLQAVVDWCERKLAELEPVELRTQAVT